MNPLAKADRRLVEEAAFAALEFGRVAADAAPLEAAVERFRFLVEHPALGMPLDARLIGYLGEALWRLAERAPDRKGLEETIEFLRQKARDVKRDEARLDWARIQNNLGSALAALGEREAGTARLEEAAAAYRLALTERTRERVPLDWAFSRHNMGLVLAILAERTGDRARLMEAIACMRDAAQVYREGNVSYWLPKAEERIEAMEAALAAMKQ